MAVYTQVSNTDLDKLLADFDIGKAVSLVGIEGGIENTNFFLTTEKDQTHHEYVLTLFEELNHDEAPFFVELGNWLAKRNVPVSFAVEDRFGIGLKQVSKRPAIIQPRYQGKHLNREELTPHHCAQIGTALAHYHQAGRDFYLTRQSHRGRFWWRRESERLSPFIDADSRDLLNQEVRLFDEMRDQFTDLPSGIIHGDLFHDNALFHNNQLSAVLDIYNAASAFWLYDLAIVANDWCVTDALTIDPLKEAALLKAYAAIRPFSDDEHTVWPQLTRTAAMRFWLSRLEPWVDAQRGSGGGKTLKDPDEYQHILKHRIAVPSSLC